MSIFKNVKQPVEQIVPLTKKLFPFLSE